MSDDPMRKQNPQSGHSGQQEQSSQQQNRYPDDPQKRPSQSGHDVERDQEKEKRDQGRRAS